MFILQLYSHFTNERWGVNRFFWDLDKWWLKTKPASKTAAVCHFFSHCLLHRNRSMFSAAALHCPWVQVNCLSHYLALLSHTSTSRRQCRLVGSRFLPVYRSRLLTRRGHWSTVCRLGCVTFWLPPGSSLFQRSDRPSPQAPPPHCGCTD